MPIARQRRSRAPMLPNAALDPSVAIRGQASPTRAE
jgi:hypothetical protein